MLLCILKCGKRSSTGNKATMLLAVMCAGWKERLLQQQLLCGGEPLSCLRWTSRWPYSPSCRDWSCLFSPSLTVSAENRKNITVYINDVLLFLLCVKHYWVFTLRFLKQNQKKTLNSISKSWDVLKCVCFNQRLIGIKGPAFCEEEHNSQGTPKKKKKRYLKAILCLIFYFL